MKYVIYFLIATTIFAKTTEGVGQGYKDTIKVSVTSENGKITDLKVLEHNETKRIGGVALDKIVPEIIEKQSYEVDNIAGATYTCVGLKDAIKDALKK